ncbi:unnamed protein product [Leptosia nina]|uniref:BPTI/Kunitz inhibitor domain-containing protein n=1 Tax=Leptosia nina TaxID=320188 RepID=A0AAV1JU99_9NEOP
MIALIVLNFVVHVCACGSTIDEEELIRDQRFLWNMSQWDAWVPDDDNKSMLEWIALYKNMTQQVEGWDESSAKANEGFPSEWDDLILIRVAYGEGMVGVPPPPWAYAPNNYGRPDFCFQFPAKGNCNDTMIRWGFNPATQRCHQFLYSGCGGNDNNFGYKASCLRACASVPESPCDKEGVDFVDMLHGYFASDNP